MTTTYEIAIRRPDDGRLLVLADRSLPSFTAEGPPPWQVVSIVGEEVSARFGLDVVTLRAAWIDDEAAAGGGGRRLYEAELVAGTPPAGARWVDDTALIEGLAGRLRPASIDRHPWYRPGWLAEMSAWIDERLADAGIRRRGPIRQVRSWGRAALLTLETDRGRMWAKAVPDVFSHEVAVTELLADIDPGIVPPVVAADRALGRIITEHVAGPTLETTDVDPVVWTAALSRLAEVQRVLAADPLALEVAGVAAAPLGRLADHLPTLLADDDLLRVDQPGGLLRDEATTLRARLPALIAACRALEATGVPDSLEHGDLTVDEIIIGEMGPVFLDWSDGSLTHPFLSAASLLADGGVVGGAAEDLAAGYLGPWVASGQITPADGLEAVNLARIVLPLHLAALYAERILPGLEQPWEADRVVPNALRTILPG
jgi:hypothetical protein